MRVLNIDIHSNNNIENNRGQGGSVYTAALPHFPESYSPENP